MAKISFYEIASVLVEHNGLEPGKANEFVKAMFDIIQERLPIDQQVKIKGLGTFKIVMVEDRESIDVNTGERILIEGHSKITFTPDTAMKELINKPFSQFETVVLKDGVAFEEAVPAKDKVKPKLQATSENELNVVLDTIAEPVDGVVGEYAPAVEEFLSVAEEVVPEGKKIDTPVVEEVVHVAEEDSVPVVSEKKIMPVVEEETNPVAEEDTYVVENHPVIDFVPSQEAESVPEPVFETPVEEERIEDSVEEASESDNVEEASVEEENDEEIESTSRIKSILLHILYVIVIACLSAYGGYWYGVNHSPAANELKGAAIKSDEPKPKKIVKKELYTDTITKDTLVKPAVVEKQQNVQQSQLPATPKPAAQPAPAAFDSDKYAAMDARVRTGAYIIVGEDRTVTVKPGETLSMISRRALGEGMECYIEVFNGISIRTELKEGQKIKIPKLQIKKKAQAK